MQLQINAPEIKTVYEQQLFNGKNFGKLVLRVAPA